jgi:hypothetical protein
MKSKRLLLVFLCFFTNFVQAKHPQCAGNPEPDKCEKRWDEMSKETPEQKQQRINSLEKSRADSMAAAAATPTRLEKASLPEPKIGMSTSDALGTYLGNPTKINKTTTAGLVKEQWVYEKSGHYLYFTNGVLVAIQE